MKMRHLDARLDDRAQRLGFTGLGFQWIKSSLVGTVFVGELWDWEINGLSSNWP